MTATLQFASPIDAWRYGEFRLSAVPAAPSIPAEFDLRIGVDIPAEAGRYHLYGGRFCPSTHRLEIIRRLGGLESAVSVSYVHGLRDARGWALRPATGPDPINGFTLLRQAYQAMDPNYSGPVSVPVLWDRVAGGISSTNPVNIGLDLISRFGAPIESLYAPSDQEHIEAFASWSRAAFSRGIPRAAAGGQAALDLVAALGELNRSLTDHPFVLGNRLTDADIRLWVVLVRYDCGPNAQGRLGPRLTTFPAIWDWARGLYARRAFSDSTDFSSFAAPLAAIPDWGDGVVTKAS